MSAESHQSYEPPAILRWLYARFFQHIHVDETWSESVRTSAERGVVVYAMRVLSILDFLCLDFLTKKFSMPLVRFVNDLGLYILEPFGRGERRLRLKRQIPEDQALRSVVDDDASALLFLRKAAPFGSRSRRGDELEVDLILTLVRAQRTMEKPIFLVPQTFVWTNSPPDRQRRFFDLFFGPTEWPGKIRVFFQFLFNYRNAVLRSGQPFDVRAFLEEHGDLDDASAADKIRYALLRRIERERALVLGPAQKSPQRIQDELLRSPRVRKHIESEAKASKRPVVAVERQARSELEKLAANQSPGVLRVLRVFLDWVFTRIYDGIVVDEEGVERLRAAAREGAVILLPSHKSHVDYLVLSWVLYGRALMPPLIAAGENLSFFPLGWVLRRGGAFFIRRSFQGKKLYASLVDAYMRKLLVEGYPIEFFLEGGRSRTGKLLPPKYGLLTMVVDASMMLGARKVYFAPISIGYERIVEERSYVHELSGGDKQSENIGDLVRTSSVLKTRYGRLYVQFGEILSFEDLVREARDEQAAHHPGAKDLEPKYRRAMVQRLAHRASYEINRVTVVTPAALVATAFLANKRRGMTHSDLRHVCSDIVTRLDRDGVRIAPQIRDEKSELREDTLREAIALFLDARLVMQHDAGEQAIYKVLEERRLALEYYKNNILHFFVSNALIATALLAEPAAATPEETLRERVKELSRLFKHEFMFRADAEFATIVDEAIASMIEADEIERVDGGVRPKPGPGADRVEMYARMLTTYFESYLLALRAAAMLLDQSMPRKDWVKKTLALGQRMYLAGEIERRESLSQLKLETTLKYLRDRGFVTNAANDQLEKGPHLDGRETLRREEAKLAPFLRL